MEKATDSGSQTPPPEIDEARKQCNAFQVVIAKMKTIFERIYGIEIKKRHIPYLIYQVWVFFYIIYIFKLIFGTHMFYKESEYSSSLTETMKTDVTAMESVMEDSTRKISSYLPDEWPHGKYLVGYYGICRKNNDSKEVCYRGNKVEELILQDIGIQIAESHGMEDTDQFGKHFMTSYRDLQKNLESEMSRRRICNDFVCTYEGLTTEDIIKFPSTQMPEDLPFYFICVNLVLAVLSFTAIILELRSNVLLLKCAIIICTTLQAIFALFAIVLTSDAMNLLEKYFMDRYFAFNIIFFVIEVIITGSIPLLCY